MKIILIPIPSYGFDPTEVAIPWKLISEKNFEVIFITPEGKQASADILMLKGENLGIWKSVLRARRDAVDAYYEMERNNSFCNPLKYRDVHEKNFDAILLPGGHDKAVKRYLESDLLQQLVADFFPPENRWAQSAMAWCWPREASTMIRASQSSIITEPRHC